MDASRRWSVFDLWLWVPTVPQAPGTRDAQREEFPMPNSVMPGYQQKSLTFKNNVAESTSTLKLRGGCVLGGPPSGRGY